MNATRAAVDPETVETELHRCAIFKIDLKGRFVYIDDLTEGLLLAPRERLFGRNIREFLSRESFNRLGCVFLKRHYYETVFDALDLEMVDANGNPHRCMAVVSLNFVGGNPSNYQVILIPPGGNQRKGKENFEAEMDRALIHFVAGLEREIDWVRLVQILVRYSGAEQVAIYRFTEKELTLLSATLAGQTHPAPFSPENIDERLRKVVISGRGYSDLQEQKADPGGRFVFEAGYPLIYGSSCWGVLRVGGAENLIDYDDVLHKLTLFLGHTLFSYLESPSKISL